MKKVLAVMALGLVAALAMRAVGLRRSAASASAAGPQYTSDGQLLLPENYRQWVYVSSGLGMNYGPAGDGNPAFTNVFVEPGAYRQYMGSGHWPDKTTFVLEIYSAAAHGSIIKQGHFQDALLAVEAEVKDESRFPEKWAYFGFGAAHKTATKIPQGACWSCHEQNAAVEHSFAQFYPTLLSVAYEKGTIKPSIHLTPSAGRVTHIALERGWSGAEPLLDQMRARDPQAEALQESSLNALGYQLLSAGKNADAVKAFERVVRDYPASANAYDSLADAYLSAGDKAKALACSRKTLEILPRDASLNAGMRGQIENAAKARIAKLEE
jgi:Cytochrome P460/Tetratricopeptide repeat